MSNILFNAYTRVFAHRVCYRLNRFLFRLALHGMGLLNHESMRLSGETHFVKKVLPRIVGQDQPLLIDVGANEGQYVQLLSERFPSALIHAFEPNPETYDRLQINCARYAATLKNVALGSRSGSATLFDRSDQAGSSHASLYRDVIEEIHDQGVLETNVPVSTLDEYCQSEGIDYIDFLKIDTEGGELSVLQGARRLLRQHRIACIQFEFNEMNIVSGTFFRDFRKLLVNFDLYRTLPSGLLPLTDSPVLVELYGYQNIVAVRRHPERESRPTVLA